ncbi:TetR/AcrR family transcriptional regulator [Parendozoicomonas haliclonae]|uniref:TetR/AcrR family transcriptional regulator n=1 Tax=Parendozoicomonas haliclonae TaxID=1960125 RepID=UPI0013FD336C|nr:TetR/AcrR family transcriptional regulator [Parendozoicomonas haliclonae]
MQTKKTEARSPSQQRSRERVDAILNAARELIEEKGSAHLKIQDIAERAGVTAGSMYQYFPNKMAIVHALAERYIDQMRSILKTALAQEFTTPEDCIEALSGALDEMLALNLRNSFIRDVWISLAADKTIEDMDIKDSRANAGLLLEKIEPFIPPENREGVWDQLFLMMHLSSATINLALSLEPEEGIRVLAASKRMFSDFIFQRIGQSVQKTTPIV